MSGEGLPPARRRALEAAATGKLRRDERAFALNRPFRTDGASVSKSVVDALLTRGLVSLGPLEGTSRVLGATEAGLRALGPTHPPAHARPGELHVTASVVVLDPERGLVLLVDHKKSGSRQLPGGHLDPGDEDAGEAAVREVREETGVEAALLDPGGGSLGYGRRHSRPLVVAEFPIAAVPERGEPEHRHLDLLYLATADSSLPTLRQVEEVDGVHWSPVGELRPPEVREDVPLVVAEAVRHLAGLRS